MRSCQCPWIPRKRCSRTRYLVLSRFCGPPFDHWSWDSALPLQGLDPCFLGLQTCPARCVRSVEKITCILMGWESRSLQKVPFADGGWLILCTNDSVRRDVISTQRYRCLAKKWWRIQPNVLSCYPANHFENQWVLTWFFLLIQTASASPTRNHIEYAFLEFHVSMREYDAGATAGGCNDDDKKRYLSLETLRFRHRFFISRTKLFKFGIGSISFKTASSDYL